MLTEAQANLLMIAVTALAFMLWWNASRIKKRIPWLSQERRKPRNAGLFYTEEDLEEQQKPVRQPPVQLHHDPARYAQPHASDARPAVQDASAGMHHASQYARDASSWLASAPLAVPSIKLSELARADNVLVVGPKGSGKTTVLRTLLDARADAERIALDPHSSPGKWPCITIGGGLAWGDIQRAMQRMQTDMQTRFEQLARGEVREGQFPRRSYVGDEFLAIAQELDGKGGNVHAGKLLILRITQGRKVGECVLIAAQNDTVEALGIQGNSDLKGCFDYIVYLGALVSSRAVNFHRCPADIGAAAQREQRPGVVWHPERNNWYVLVHDLEPVTEDMKLSTVSAPGVGGIRGGISEVVSPQGVVSGGIERDTTLDTGIGTSDTTPDTGDGFDDETIKALHSAGWSANKIATRMKGKKQDRLARIRAATGEVGEVISA